MKRLILFTILICLFITTTLTPVAASKVNDIPSMSQVNELLAHADKYIGTPYKWGADPYSENSRLFDCSSFTKTVFREGGIELMRNSRQQSTQGETVVSVSNPGKFIGSVESKGERLQFDQIKSHLQKGDLLFFDNQEEAPNVEKIHHVAIYVNEYTLLHATETMGVNYTYFRPERKDNIVMVKRFVDEEVPEVSPADIIETGEKYLETPFSSMNASSFVREVFLEHGIKLPNTSHEMSSVGADIPRQNLKAGDLVFFDADHDGVITHVAIFIDDDKLLQSTVSGGVSYTRFSTYWQNAYAKSKRILDRRGSFPLNEELLKTAESYVGETQIEDIAPVQEDGEPPLVTPDTSKFVQRVFRDHEIGMSRTSNEQMTVGDEVSFTDASPGDLLFVDSNGNGRSNYVGFYVDENAMLLATKKAGVHYKELTPALKAQIMTVKRVGV